MILILTLQHPISKGNAQILKGRNPDLHWSSAAIWRAAEESLPIPRIVLFWRLIKRLDIMEKMVRQRWTLEATSSVRRKKKMVSFANCKTEILSWRPAIWNPWSHYLDWNWLTRMGRVWATWLKRKGERG